MYTIPRTGCRLGGAPTSTSAAARRCRQSSSSSSSSSVKTRRSVPSSSSSSRSLFFPKLNAFSSSSSLRLSIGRTSATATGENNRARERRQKEEVERRQLPLRKKNFSRSRSRRTAGIRTNSLLRFGGGGFQQQTLFAPEALFVIAALSAIVIATAAMIKRVFKTNGEMSDKREKVVVIGGGFAGMQAVFDLAKTCDVTLVDTKAYFEYTPGALSAMLGGGPMRRYKGSGHSGERIGK